VVRKEDADKMKGIEKGTEMWEPKKQKVMVQNIVQKTEDTSKDVLMYNSSPEGLMVVWWRQWCLVTLLYLFNKELRMQALTISLLHRWEAI
jgi:hypothetical protein